MKWSSPAPPCRERRWPSWRWSEAGRRRRASCRPGEIRLRPCMPREGVGRDERRARAVPDGERGVRHVCRHHRRRRCIPMVLEHGGDHQAWSCVKVWKPGLTLPRRSPRAFGPSHVERPIHVAVLVVRVGVVLHEGHLDAVLGERCGIRRSVRCRARRPEGRGRGIEGSEVVEVDAASRAARPGRKDATASSRSRRSRSSFANTGFTLCGDVRHAAARRASRAR